MKWHNWHGEELPPSSTGDRHLEQQLGWAEDTIAVLRRAFTLRLPRHVGWQAPPHAAFRDAARYYKRGVALQGKPRPLLAPHTQLRGVTQLSDLQPYFVDSLVVCDQQVAQLHTCNVPQMLTVGATEERKNLTAVAELVQKWHTQGSPQRWTIVGGGITLDVAVFAAALCKAKIVLIPTTLLAMIDAAHGGKNGVNFSQWGKNQLGTYYFAELVVICPAWLQTLPPEELQAGGWEGVKHALIAGDKELLHTWLQYLNRPPTTWQLPLLQKTAQIKTAIVQRDPYEHGVRRVLNFGHTLAHALEAVAQENNTQLRHGHAVGIGILYALLLSQALGKIKKIPQIEALSNCQAMLTHAELAKALGYHDLNAPQLWARLQHYIAQDKKQHNAATWLLLQDSKPLPRISADAQAVPETTQHAVWQQLLRVLL